MEGRVGKSVHDPHGVGRTLSSMVSNQRAQGQRAGHVKLLCGVGPLPSFPASPKLAQYFVIRQESVPEAMDIDAQPHVLTRGQRLKGEWCKFVLLRFFPSSLFVFITNSCCVIL